MLNCCSTVYILLFYSSATYNKIESIDQDTFEEMDRLSDLYLDHNEITTIQARTFKDFQFMKIL